MEYRQELSLELNSNTAYSTVGAKQGDNNSRVIIIHVTENGVDYNLNENGGELHLAYTLSLNGSLASINTLDLKIEPLNSNLN